MSVVHVIYDEEHYTDGASVIGGMRDHMREGWLVAVIRGPSRGPFAVVYRRESTTAR